MLYRHHRRCRHRNSNNQQHQYDHHIITSERMSLSSSSPFSLLLLSSTLISSSLLYFIVSLLLMLMVMVVVVVIIPPHHNYYYYSQEQQNQSLLQIQQDVNHNQHYSIAVQCETLSSSSEPSEVVSVISVVPLGGNCSDLLRLYCGVDATCSLQSGTCICTLGYQPSDDGKNCDQFICDQDADCLYTFGPNTHCIESGCFCVEGYELDYSYYSPSDFDDPPSTSETTTVNSKNDSSDNDNSNSICVPASQLIGGACDADSECGIGTQCIQGVCKCKFGKVISVNGQDCELYRCSTDDECKRMDNNSHCMGRLHCKCDSGLHLDVDVQICSKSNVKYFYIVGFIIEVIAVLLVYQ